MFLVVLWQASPEVQNVALWVQQLQCQEEGLERQPAAMECMLQGPSRSFPSSWSGGPPTTQKQAQLVIWQQVEVEQPLAEGVGWWCPQVRKHTTSIQYILAKLWDLMKRVWQRSGKMIPGGLLHLWADGTKGIELSPKEMAQLASIMVIPSHRQCLQKAVLMAWGEGNP